MSCLGRVVWEGGEGYWGASSSSWNEWEFIIYYRRREWKKGGGSAGERGGNRWELVLADVLGKRVIFLVISV